MKGFSKSWIDSATSVKKGNIEKHVKGDLHLHAANFEKKTLGDTCNQQGIHFLPNREGISKDG